jgi:hypothetical protein
MAAEDSVRFTSPESERTMSSRTWMIAALAIAFAVGIVAVATRHRGGEHSNAAKSPDAYAASLPITNMSLSEATNGAGGKSTYVDGTIKNTGTKTVSAVRVQVTFATADGTPPHRETVPVALVRTREPYVDLQPISADPLKPGDSKDFRLIFEQVSENWDVKPPAITVVYAAAN